MTKLRLAALLQLLLPVALVIGISAGLMTQAAEGGWVAGDSFEREQAVSVMQGKPVNTWTTEDLEAAGFAGCVSVVGDHVEWGHLPVAHVVRTSVKEGWRWVRMTPAEVAARTEAFGGTTTRTDDVKLVGNCY